MRARRHLSFLATAALAACGSDGSSRFVPWPEVPPDTLSFLLHKNGSVVIHGPFSPAGPESPLPLSEGTSVIYAIERAAIEELHPLVDATRLEETGLVFSSAACAGCGACLVEDRGRILAPLPPFPATRTWKREVEGQFLPLEGAASPDDHLLSLPVPSECEASVEAELELELELPSGSWARTVPVGDGSVWVHGADLLWVRPDGSIHALTSQLELTGAQDIKATGDGAFLATLDGPPRVARVSTSTGGIVLERVWALGSSGAWSVAPAEGGGFVATTLGLGELWVSEAGADARRVDIPFGRTATDILLSPFNPAQYFVGAGFGIAIIIDPFHAPDAYLDAKISSADKQIFRFAARQGANGPEVWAVTNGAGLYVRDAALHAANDWKTSDAILPSAPDGCAAAPECGFATLNRNAVEVDALGENVIVRVEACAAIVLMRPDRSCATRLEMPSEAPKGLSLEAERIWGLRRGTLLGIRLPGR